MPLMEPLASLLEPLDHLVEVLRPLAEPTVLFPNHLFDPYISETAQSAGLSLSQFKVIIGLFLAIPLGYVFLKLPNVLSRHIFNVILGISLAQFCFEVDWIHTIFSGAVTYLILLLSPRDMCCVAIFSWSMLYMSLCHLYLLKHNYLFSYLDFSGTQMVLTIKMSSIGYNLYDGTVGRSKATESQLKYSIAEVPSILEYISFIFCAPTYIAGPAMEFRVFKDSMEQDMLKDGSRNKNMISSPIKTALYKLGQGIFFMVMYLVLDSKFPAKFLISDLFLELPWWQRLGVLKITTLSARFKYYFAWKVAESSSNMAGFGSEGVDPKTGKVIGWSAVQNVDIPAIETAESTRNLLRSWNKATQAWLERYVYTRTKGSLVTTYFVSAFWHGFYPGFYLFFLSFPLVTIVERAIRKKLKPIFFDNQSAAIQTVITWFFVFVSVTTIEYFGAAFILYELSAAWKFYWQGCFLFGQVMVVASWAVLTFLVPDPPARGAVKRE